MRKGLASAAGVQATSMRDLATAAGILPSSLYSHFKSKEALADEILREYLEDVRRRCEQIDETGGPPVGDARGRRRLGTGRRVVAVITARGSTNSKHATQRSKCLPIELLHGSPSWTYERSFG